MLALTDPLSSGLWVSTSTVCNVLPQQAPFPLLVQLRRLDLFNKVHSYNDVDGFAIRASLSTYSLKLFIKNFNGNSYRVDLEPQIHLIVYLMMKNSKQLYHSQPMIEGQRTHWMVQKYCMNTKIINAVITLKTSPVTNSIMHCHKLQSCICSSKLNRSDAVQ